MIAVTALLWLSLLIGPLVTGSFRVWTKVPDAPDGMARLSNTLGVLVFAVVSFSAAYGLAAFALLIQIWRDQWRMKLTGVAVAFLFLLFVAHAWFITLPGKPRAGPAADPNRAPVPTLNSTPSVRGSEGWEQQK